MTDPVIIERSDLYYLARQAAKLLGRVMVFAEDIDKIRDNPKI